MLKLTALHKNIEHMFKVDVIYSHISYKEKRPMDQDFFGTPCISSFRFSYDSLEGFLRRKEKKVLLHIQPLVER